MLESINYGSPDFQGGVWREAKLPGHLQSSSAENLNGKLPLVGLLSQASQDGRWLVYTSLDMGRYLEFAEADIVGFDRLPSEKSPFGRLGGTRIFLKPDAEIRVHRAAPISEGDEFDLDLRLADKEHREGDEAVNTFGQPGCGPEQTGAYCTPACVGNKTDHGKTCNDVNTCVNYTCHTCAGEGQTCGVTCNQATCGATCQGTCETCATRCAGATCGKARTCDC